MIYVYVHWMVPSLIMSPTNKYLGIWIDDSPSKRMLMSSLKVQYAEITLPFLVS